MAFLNPSLPTQADGWMLGPFARPDNAQPIITPRPESLFDCPMLKKPVRWEAPHTFDPAAVVRDGKVRYGKVCLLYRAEDDSGSGSGGFTSRLRLACSSDGIHFTRPSTPVLYPAEDEQKTHEWEGGCEDPRVVEAEDGTYVLFYTHYRRLPGEPRESVPAMGFSIHLIHWTKTGPVRGAGPTGKMLFPSKSAALVTTVRDGRGIATKINGNY